MTRTSFTTSFATNLPEWIRQWALSLRENKDLPDGEITTRSPAEQQTLERLLSDVLVANDLSDLDRCARIEKDENRKALKELVCCTCFVYQQSQQKIFAAPKDFSKRLENLASKLDELASELTALQHFIGPAIDTRYLSERLSTEEPRGFPKRHRFGLRGSIYSAYEENYSLIELIEALKDDVNEERQMFPQRIKTLHGGEDAHIRYQGKYLKKVHYRLFGQDNNPIIARLLTAANGREVSIRRIANIKI